MGLTPLEGIIMGTRSGSIDPAIDLPAGIDTDQVCRIVERCQIIALLDRPQHFVIDDYRRGKLLSAMYHTVANCIDLVERLDVCCGKPAKKMVYWGRAY